MSRDEVVGLIGTIAKSGTAELLRKLRESEDGAASSDLIGQFGVGFYSTFMVADRVTLLTGKAGASGGTRWESDGAGTYVIETVDDAPRGTAVTVHLKPEDSEDRLYDYTDENKIREIVKRYSDFIAWPIRLVSAPAANDRDSGRRRDSRVRLRRRECRRPAAQLDEGAVGSAAERGRQGRVRPVLPPPQPRLDRPARGHPHEGMERCDRGRWG
jgi:HSP90 family molecular chaperone